jgi:hypothetical protein
MVAVGLLNDVSTPPGDAGCGEYRDVEFAGQT